MQSLMAVEFLLSRPIMRKAVGEIAAYTKLLEDTNVRDHLASIVRSRLWEALQLNPDNDVSLLLDCYITAVSLGGMDSGRVAAAESAIEEIAERMASELTKIHREAAA